MVKLIEKNGSLHTSQADIVDESVTADSRQGKTLLRRISRNSDGWSGKADANTGWRLILTYSAKGKLGEPDYSVSVLTDIEITPRRNRTTDWDGDTKIEVSIPNPRRIHLRYELATVCHLIVSGWTIEASSTLGSLNTSRLGIGYWRLTARHPASHYINVTISETTYLEGRQLTSGAIE